MEYVKLLFRIKMFQISGSLTFFFSNSFIECVKIINYSSQSLFTNKKNLFFFKIFIKFIGENDVS
jgi:hypothetical protein